MTRLKDLRVKHGLTQREVAKRIGVSQPTYSSWETGKTQMSYMTMLRAAAMYGVSLEYLLRAEDDRNLSWRNIHITKSKAPEIIKENYFELPDEEVIPPSMAITGEFFALEIKGDSMAPRMMEGDVVIVKRQSDCENGDIAVVTAKGGFSAIKKLYKNENGITLISLNSVYEPICFSNDEIESEFVKIIGKVVELRGKL